MYCCQDTCNAYLRAQVSSSRSTTLHKSKHEAAVRSDSSCEAHITRNGLFCTATGGAGGNRTSSWRC
jgi:hypothetical protein